MKLVTFRRSGGAAEPGVLVGGQIVSLVGAGFGDMLSVIGGGAGPRSKSRSGSISPRLVPVSRWIPSS